MPDQPTEQQAPPRKGKATQALAMAQAAEHRANEAHDAATEADEGVNLARIDMLREFVNGGNFKIAAFTVAAILLGPVIIMGTWLIDGGIKADGWGCYGTAAFCRHDSVEGPQEAVQEQP